MNTRTNRLQLRPFVETDRMDVVTLLTDAVIKKTYMLPDFSQPEQADKLFCKLMEYSLSENHYVRGICLDETVIGFINDTEIQNGSIELGWVVHPKHHNQGYATQAVSAAITDLFARGFTEVIAGAFEENPASIRVMQKCGMKLLDKTEEIEYRGTVHHCVFYAAKRETRIMLETKRLLLRNVRPEDAAIMYAYRNNEVCARYQRGQTKDLPGIEALVTRRIFDEISDQENFLIAVEYKDSGEMIGEIVVMPNDGCFSIGYTFHYAHHRKGYAYEALSMLTDLLHERYPNMEFISFTEPENVASMALLKKLGYQDLGYEPKVESQVFGKWLHGEDWR